MLNEYFLNNLDKVPFVSVKNGKVIRVSQPLVDMTKYTYDELLNNNILDIFKILRVGPGSNCENIDDTVDYFLFTKSLEVKLISISIIEKEKERVYVFIDFLAIKLTYSFIKSLIYQCV